MALMKLWANREFTDVKFHLKNGDSVVEVCAHKCIFAVSSPVFRAMLFGGWKESEEIVVLENVDIDVFNSLTEFIYTERTEFKSISHAIAVYTASDKYEVLDLKEKAHEYLLDNLNVAYAFEVYEFSIFHCNAEIERACLNLIKNDTQNLLNSDKFIECDIKSLEVIAGLNELNVTELQLFNAVDEWVKFNVEKKGDTVENLRPLLFNILSKIRFLSMTAAEFSQGPGLSNLLSSEERVALLVNLLNPGSLPIPDGFTTLKEFRIHPCGRLVEIGKGCYLWYKPNISSLEVGLDYYSPSFNFCNLPFCLKLMRTNGQPYDFDGYLCCDATNNEHRIKVNCTWKRKSQKEGVPDTVWNENVVLNKNTKCVGWGMFWSYSTDPEKGFIKDDVLVFEIQLELTD